MQSLTNAETTSALDKILASDINIPPQPAILLEIEKLLNKPGDNLSAIGKLLGKDAGLSAAIFKLVNSPFYRRSVTISSIPKAVAILGINQVINLVKGLALKKALGGNELVYEKFWERSEEIAVLASIIAGKQVSVCNIAMDQAYMAGLFHECGVPILLQRFPDYCKLFRLNEGSNWPDFREEDHSFNTDHTVVGFLVARHWNLPDFICQAVRFHHDRLSVEHSALTMVSILQLARHLHKRLHRLTDDEWPQVRKQALEEIGIHLESEAEFVEDVLERFNQAN